MVDYNKNIIIGYFIGNITHDSYFEKNILYIYIHLFLLRDMLYPEFLKNTVIKW